MPTNLQLSIPNFVRVDGYFFHLNHTNDTLFQKTDDGTNAFSYPLDTDIVNPVVCLQHDGRFFYTMENSPTANSNNGLLLIKKWLISDFILKLQRIYTINGTGIKKYDSNSFSIEHFHRTFSVPGNSGSATVTLDSNARLLAGDVLNLGPSNFIGFQGLREQVTILSVGLAGSVTFTTNLVNSYNATDKISVARKCWFFNKFRPNDSDPVNGSGQIYSFLLNPAGNPDPTPEKIGNEFRTVLASTYLSDPNYPGGARDFLVYANQTNLLFIETDPANVNYRNTIQSAAQNNQETDSTIIPIFDLTHEGETLFRLQQKATFRTGPSENTESWEPLYNYQLSTLERLPTSISMTADPAIIPADGVTTSDITAIVKDQFDNPIASRTVNFTDDDTSGSPQGQISPSSDLTDSNGVANSQYTAGTIAKTVTVGSST